MKLIILAKWIAMVEKLLGPNCRILVAHDPEVEGLRLAVRWPQANGSQQYHQASISLTMGDLQFARKEVFQARLMEEFDEIAKYAKGTGSCA